MLTRVRMSPGDTARLPLACDPDVVEATARRYTAGDSPTDDERASIVRALAALRDEGDVTLVAVPETASYVVVKPLTDEQIATCQADDKPFVTQLGAVVLDRVQSTVGDDRMAVAEALAELPKKRADAVTAFLEHQVAIRDRKARAALVEIDGHTGDAAWAAVKAIADPVLRREVIDEIAAIADRLNSTPGKA